MTLEVGKGVSSEKPQTRSHLLQVETRSRVEFKEITETLQKLISESGVLQGTCFVFVPHTTAAVLINENYDRGLQKDWDDFLNRLAPRDRDYHHDDGNCDSHLKAALIGNSKSLFIEHGASSWDNGRAFSCAILTGRGGAKSESRLWRIRVM